MRAIIQRVTQAKVEVDGAITGEIAAGLLVLLGASRLDSPADADYLAEKIVQLRIFADEARYQGRADGGLAKMNADNESPSGQRAVLQ
jgi:D-tyrosyl-tRNA(Tyr) deacylase